MVQFALHPPTVFLRHLIALVVLTSQVQPRSGPRGGKANEKNSTGWKGSRLEAEQWKPFHRQSIRRSRGSFGCRGCSVHWGMVRVGRVSQPLVTGKDAMMLEQGSGTSAERP